MMQTEGFIVSSVFSYSRGIAVSRRWRGGNADHVHNASIGPQQQPSLILRTAGFSSRSTTGCGKPLGPSMAESEGDRSWKAAQKLTSPSFLSLRLQSDWEQAGPLYEKAASSFRVAHVAQREKSYVSRWSEEQSREALGLSVQQARAWDKARDAYEMAARCAQRQNSPWHAAKHLERAAEAAKELQNWTLGVDYFKQASLAYREAGRSQSAADALSKGARLIEEKNPQAAADLLAEAVEEVESDGKLGLAGDLYRLAIGTYIRCGQHPEAVGMLLRFATACDETQATASQCKAYLGAVVVWLFAANGAQAFAVYQDALEVDKFAQSGEAVAAEALIEAYRSGAAEEVRRCISTRPVFMDLDNQVARLAKKLPQGDVRAVGAALGGHEAPARTNSELPTLSAEEIDKDDFT